MSFNYDIQQVEKARYLPDNFCKGNIKKLMHVNKSLNQSRKDPQDTPGKVVPWQWSCPCTGSLLRYKFLQICTADASRRSFCLVYKQY
jgi:hypothetical protein